MIVISDTELEEVLKQLLQRHLKLCINGRLWREGRLILFKQSGFYLEFIISSKKKNRERFEIPIPFKTSTFFERHIVYFNYQIETLSGKNSNLLRMLKEIKPVGKSRFYDTILDIQIIPDIIIK
jgi:hypothetical protein